MNGSALKFRPVAPTDPGISELIAAHVAHSQRHSPDTSNFTLTHDALTGPDTQVFGLYDGDLAVACGALTASVGGLAEVKSVHVAAAARGRGLGREIMDALICAGRKAGFTALALETGSEQLPGYDAARALYHALGFQPCGPIPGYSDHPDCAFFRLDLVLPDETEIGAGHSDL